MSKRKLASQMDSLDVTDRHYDKKYQDMQNRLYDFYDEREKYKPMTGNNDMALSIT